MSFTPPIGVASETIESLDAVILAEPAEARTRRRWVSLGVLRTIALLWVVLIVGAAVLAPILPLHSPTKGGLGVAHPPFQKYGYLGTDELGRDILSRIIYGARVSLLIAGVSVAVALTIGVFLGLLTGYLRGKLDTAVNAAIDVILAFPGIILLTVVVSFAGPSIRNLIIAIAIIKIPPFMRLARANTLAYAKREFVLAARGSGAKTARILFREVLPNVLPTIMAYTFAELGLVFVLEGSSKLPRARNPIAHRIVGRHDRGRSDPTLDVTAHRADPRHNALHHGDGVQHALRRTDAVRPPPKDRLSSTRTKGFPPLMAEAQEFKSVERTYSGYAAADRVYLQRVYKCTSGGALRFADHYAQTIADRAEVSPSLVPVGAWQTLYAPQEEVIHIYEFDSLASLQSDVDLLLGSRDPSVAPLPGVESQSSKVMRGLPYCPEQLITDQPRPEPDERISMFMAVFCTRSGVGDFIEHFHKGLKARSNVADAPGLIPVGAWRNIYGARYYEVNHIYSYESMGAIEEQRRLMYTDPAFLDHIKINTSPLPPNFWDWGGANKLMKPLAYSRMR